MAFIVVNVFQMAFIVCQCVSYGIYRVNVFQMAFIIVNVFLMEFIVVNMFQRAYFFHSANYIFM
jgi:hypothetical protein